MSVLRLTGIIIFSALSLRIACAQEISVSTDKQLYSPSETIRITVKNISSQSVFSQAAGATPEFAISNVERKLSVWSWDAYRLHCPSQECDIAFDAPREIKAGKSAVFDWKPSVYSDKRNVAPQPGLWRMTFIYQLRKGKDPKSWIWKTVKSNEFTLQ